MNLKFDKSKIHLNKYISSTCFVVRHLTYPKGKLNYIECVNLGQACSMLRNGSERFRAVPKAVF